MPEQKLGDREYKLFKNWLEKQGWRWPFGIGLPENKTGIRESQQYRDYIQSGEAPTAITARAADIQAEIGRPLGERVTVAPPTPSEIVQRPQREAEAALRQVPGAPSAFDPTKPREVPPFPEVNPPQGMRWEFNTDYWSWVPRRTPEAPLRGAPQAAVEAPWQESQRMWQQQQAEQQFAWQQQQAGAVSPFQEQQLGFQQQQLAQGQAQFQQGLAFQQSQAQARQQEIETQERARLGAQPISWLQFAQYTGEQPVVQPWMLPLQPEEAGFQIGETIPGWSPETLANLPELQRPSAQMWARMGPTSQQQFLGYRQARTGARPEETQFRLQAASPPGGRFGALRWTR